MASYTAPYPYATVTTGTVTLNGGSGVAGTAYSNVTLNGGAGTNYNWSTASPYVTVANGSSTPSITVTGNAEFDGDIKWKGKDLGKLLETIEKRLAILEPNPKKLERFEALRKAYDHYKLLEALCHEDDDDK